MQYFKFLKTLRFIAVASSMVVVVFGDITCNVCQTNHAKCVNETHFSLCLDGVPPDQVMPCPDDQICTSTAKFCMPRGSVAPSCISDADVECPSCDGSSLFVCTSRTTFQMCNGDTLSSQITKCKDNTYCAISQSNFCVDRCEALSSATGFQCDREAPLTG
uniref:Uncharacterized protein LOC108053275 n=1 Tax=Drosophila rhopaloa TaxID=1041015 RepID=A0A6P4FNQ3_DRORH